MHLHGDSLRNAVRSRSLGLPNWRKPPSSGFGQLSAKIQYCNNATIAHQIMVQNSRTIQSNHSRIQKSTGQPAYISTFLQQTTSQDLPFAGGFPAGTHTLACRQSSSHKLSLSVSPKPGCGHTPQPPVNRAGFLFVP
jgi:hypothetical protein